MNMHIDVNEIPQVQPIEIYLDILGQYIYQMTGTQVSILYPRNQQEIELFERMINIACAYYGY